MSQAILTRQVFTTNRATEFFSEKELTMQIGAPKPRWAITLLKELIDNALDACESIGVTPVIDVETTEDWFSVRDNGCGFPGQVIEASLDYSVRVSSNNHYIAPTRGQLGNALKCLWAVAFVATGTLGIVEIHSQGKCHTVQCWMDEIEQQPKLSLEESPSDVQSGSIVKIHWKGWQDSASCTDPQVFTSSPLGLLLAYGFFNPHLEISLTEKGGTTLSYKGVGDFKKWTPTNPTSAWWYSPRGIENLILHYIRQERGAGQSRFVREFVSEFDGLSSSGKQKRIAEATGLAGKTLDSLLCGNRLDTQLVLNLFCAMREESKPISASRLGSIGSRSQYLRELDIDCARAEYFKVTSPKDCEIPFVVEAWFAPQSGSNALLTFYALNHSPLQSCPAPFIDWKLQDREVEEYDGVFFGLHVCYPRLSFTDRGKSLVEFPLVIREALEKVIDKVTHHWYQQKKILRRSQRLENGDYLRNRKPVQISTKEAAYQVMERAYLQASGDKRYPANARQIMYAARPLVMELTGGKCWKDSAYFTQTLLPDFMVDHPTLVSDWDVVYDARGFLHEPHTEVMVPLGTVDVRDYIKGQSEPLTAIDEIIVSQTIRTSGHSGRYGAVLFIEKEGFNAILKAARIPERFDLALFSTKGMSTTSSRSLVEYWSKKGVPIFLLHDFDSSGITIAHTIANDSRRYRFETKPVVIDLGLRFEDIVNLQSEPVRYQQGKNPRESLQRCGATPEEAAFLVRSQSSDNCWEGERVELNALTAPQFISLVESKLLEHGVSKVVPDKTIVEAAYRRAVRMRYIQAAIDQAIAATEGMEIEVPASLPDRIAEQISNKTKTWDDAVFDIASEG